MSDIKNVKVETPEETVKKHGLAKTVSHRRMDDGKWKTISTDEDNHTRTAMSRSAKLCFSEGGSLAWVSSKRLHHPAQQGSFNSEHDIVSPETA